MDALLAYNVVVDECFKFSITILLNSTIMLVTVLHYASICSYASILLLCSKLCQHNSPRPRACTSLLDSLYWFGGWDGSAYYNSLHRLDSTTLEWKELQPLNQADGPMRKFGCGMVSVFGGYGIPTGPTQPEAIFNDYADGSEWSNEFHVFNITEGMWVLHYPYMMRDMQ